MSLAWWDASVGAAGDMLLAAHIDAGADLGVILRGLGALELDDWALQLDEVRRAGLRGLCATVELGHDPSPRSWQQIDALLQHPALPERVQQRARATFRRLGEAEAAVHGVPLEAVHFHEVGAVDAIVDIVGTCLALEDLDVDELVATPLPMGTGRVEGAHGTLPLPAPATLSLVQGWPTVPAAWPGEWVTPTAAALITTLATPGPMPAMVPAAIGVGAGQRDPAQVANLLRVVLAAPNQPKHPGSDEVIALAANLDDLTPELLAGLLPLLLEAGALDAWIVPALMKRGRPGHVLHALAPPALEDALCLLILRHSSSLGVRRQRQTRRLLQRHHDTVHTPYGSVRVKVGGLDGAAWHVAPEHRDVAACALSAGVPEQEVYRAALAAWAPAPAKG